MIRKRARGIRDTEYFKLKIRQSSLADNVSMFYSMTANFHSQGRRRANKIKQIYIKHTVKISCDFDRLFMYPMSHVVKNGQYMRKFLDVYYPFLVTLRILYPKNLTKLKTTKHREQSRFTVENHKEKLLNKAWFEDKLNMKIGFSNLDFTSKNQCNVRYEL